MAAMEGALQNQPPQPLQQQQQPQPAAVERLNDAVQQQLNLKSVKDRATNLFKAITRILEDLDGHARTNTTPKWQELLSQYSMVNLELFNIVDEIKKVSKAFVVYPKNVNAENAVVLPVMLSSKLLPEMEVEDNAKREQLLLGLQSLQISTQIDKLKARIDMIGAACESAEKVLADTRKAYCIGTRQGIPVVPTLDKAQAAKIQEQENLLRAAVNYGEALRLPPDQRQNPPALPMHLVDVLGGGDGGVQAFPEASGAYSKNTPVSSSNLSGQSPLMQVPGSQLMGRSAASPGGTSITNFDNTTTSPLPYANSPRSSTNVMNTPSPQQQSQQQKQQQQQQQQQHQHQQQKLMQLPHQQQLLAQQQFRQSAMQGLGQSPLQQLHDLQGQTQQKFQSLHGQHQMQFSPSMGHQQFQGRQLPSGHVPHGIGSNQLNPGSQMNRHLSQFSGAANSALFNAAQTTPNQMIPNMSATMSSQSLLPRMQFEMPGNNPQRSHASQILSDQMFNMGATNTGGMMPLQQQQQQQQQHGSQGAFGNMAQNAQNLQSNMVALQGTPQNHPNFNQQRQQNQQQ